MGFQYLFIKVAEIKDISKDAPVIKVSDGMSQCKEEGRGSGKKVLEPIGHGIGGRVPIDRGGIDFGNDGLGVWSILGG